MQTGNREYLGRNEFWTPSTIGLTQSLIDTSINKIELKDNSSGESNLFKIENNKLKSTIPLICDDPTENEEVSNKKYVDNKSNEITQNINNNYYNKTTVDSKLSVINSKFDNYYQTGYLDSQFNSINNTLQSLIGYAAINNYTTNPLTNNEYTIENIPNLSFTDFNFTQTTPTITITTPDFYSTSSFVSVEINFYIYTTNSSNINAMKDLVCSINKKENEPLSTSGNKPIIVGKINDEKIYAKYEFTTNFAYGIGKWNGKENLYLHFFYEYDKSYSNVSFTLDNKSNNQLEVTFSEIAISGFGNN